MGVSGIVEVMGARSKGVSIVLYKMLWELTWTVCQCCLYNKDT